MSNKIQASPESLQQISELLRHELALCQVLHQALLAEFEALKKRDDVSEFAEVIEQKHACVAQLETNEKGLFTLISAAGFDQTKQGLQAFLDSIDSRHDAFAIKPAWTELRTLIVECQRQNQVNGRILNISLINTQQALNLLSGRDANPSVYDNHGKTSDKDPNQSIAVA